MYIVHSVLCESLRYGVDYIDRAARASKDALGIPQDHDCVDLQALQLDGQL